MQYSKSKQLMWWNTVILNRVEHSHYPIRWESHSQFGGTLSFLNLWSTVISQFDGAQSLPNLVEHSHSQFGGTLSFLNFVEHSHF